MNDKSATTKWFVSHDLDGFFGLAIDNLVQLIVIIGLCSTVCGMPPELVYGRILPGAALSVVFGNLFYSWQARQLMRKTNRSDVTALPYGINTPSLFAYIFFVISPVYQQTGNPTLAWQIGLVACLGSGVIEFTGSFIAGWIRRQTPRAALLSTLAGIAVTFISMEFALQIFDKPLYAMIPLVILLIQYLTGYRYPLNIPGGLLAVLAGSLLAWLMTFFGNGPMDISKISGAVTQLHFHPPFPCLADLWAALLLPESWKYLGIIIPMGLFNVIGSLQNIESAEAAGDTYPVTSSLAVNGLGSLLGACLGSCFPTTIYIGHPGWKRMGARAGYSIYNAIFVSFLCLFGAMPLVLSLVPLEAGVAVVLWIGIIITAQAFQVTPREHAPAVAIGLFPAVAAWGYFVVETSLALCGKKMGEVIDSFTGLRLVGLIHLNQGFILTCMIWSAMAVAIIERKFLTGALWMLVAGILSAIGLIHSFEVRDGLIVNHFGIWTSPQFTISYLLAALILFGFGVWLKKHPQEVGSVEIG